jgi:hypothetical protein
MSVDEYFATGPAFERPIYEVVAPFVETLGPVIVEFVSVGIFFKKPSGWMQLRPKRAWVSMTFPTRRAVRHRTITTKPMTNGPASTTTWYAAKLAVPTDFDESLRDLLAESYDL